MQREPEALRQPRAEMAGAKSSTRLISPIFNANARAIGVF
jgi:hypothetical protein